MKSHSHTRPKIRRRNHSESNNGITRKKLNKTSVDQLLESTRKRMDDVRLTLEQRHGKDHLNLNLNSTSSPSSSSVVTAGVLKGVLSQQQGSNGTSVTYNDANRDGNSGGSTSMEYTNLQKGHTKETLMDLQQIRQQQRQQQHQQHQQQQQPPARKSSIIKDTIVERPFPKANNEQHNVQQTQQQQTPKHDSMQIEGYTPTRCTDIPEEHVDNDTHKNDDTMARNNTNVGDNKADHVDDKHDGDNTPETIEVDVEFQCMTESEYKSAIEISHALGMTVGEFLSKQKEVIDEEQKEKRNQNESETTSMNCQYSKVTQDDYNHDDDDGTNEEEDLFSFFGPDSDDSDEDSVIVLDPKRQRPFITLWNALSTWITPKSVKILQQYRSELFDHDHNEKYSAVTNHHPSSTNSTTIDDADCHNQYNSDIAISRCEGLMSIMKMNVSKALDDLGYRSGSASTCTDKHIMRQLAHSRLAEFIQSFDFSEPMVKFDTKMWYAMSVVLLEILLPTTTNTASDGVNSRKDYERQDGSEKSDTRDLGDLDSRTRCIKLPSSIVAVDIGVEEYYYLTHTAIPSLSKGLVDTTEL